MSHKVAFRAALALLLILVPLEILACIASYETLGAVDSYILVLICALLDIFGFTLCLVLFWPSAIVMISLVLLFAGYQAHLVARMHTVAAESDNIVEWAYQERSKTGSFPEDLEGYSFLHRDCERFVHYEKFTHQDEFGV